MKKNLLFILCLGISSVMMSQTFVSTTAENKNVVLEEFTGIQGMFRFGPGGVAERGLAIYEVSEDGVEVVDPARLGIADGRM